MAGGGAGGGGLSVLALLEEGTALPPGHSAMSLAPWLPTLFTEPLLTEVAPTWREGPRLEPRGPNSTSGACLGGSHCLA